MFTAPPSLGRDTAAVMQELLGYDADQMEALRQQGVVG
jgi:crotonobetainyl-CoA:carnitine CoA-transferase CaiB-like acyl-CoA transferase